MLDGRKILSAVCPRGAGGYMAKDMIVYIKVKNLKIRERRLPKLKKSLYT